MLDGISCEAMNIERAVQVVHVVSSEYGVNIHVICVRTAPSAIHNKLDATARLGGPGLPVTTHVLR